MSLLLSRIKILASTRSAPSAVREREAALCKFHQKKILSRRGQLLAKTTCKHGCCFYYYAARAHACINFNKVKHRRYILLAKVYKPGSAAVQTLCKLCVLPGLLSGASPQGRECAQDSPLAVCVVCAACTERFMCAN